MKSGVLRVYFRRLQGTPVSGSMLKQDSVVSARTCGLFLLLVHASGVSFMAASITYAAGTVPYTVFSNDLLQTCLGSVDASSLQYNSWYDYGNVATLAGGIDNTDSSNNWAFPIVGGTLTYYLDTSTGSGGYVVSNINVFGGWPYPGRDAQNYTVSYSTVSSATHFVDIATIAYNPPGSAPSYTRVGIADVTGGVLATGVKAIRFRFGAQENGAGGYREIDVLGAAIPVTQTNQGVVLYREMR